MRNSGPFLLRLGLLDHRGGAREEPAGVGAVGEGAHPLLDALRGGGGAEAVEVGVDRRALVVDRVRHARVVLRREHRVRRDVGALGPAQRQRTGRVDAPPSAEAKWATPSRAEAAVLRRGIDRR